MADRRKLLSSLVLTLALLAANLVALNALLAHWTTARVDLTEDRLYSISPATRRILTSLDQPVLIRGYFSKRTHPKLAPLVPRIEDLLAEYRAISGGKVEVEIVDPREDEEAAHEAKDRYGVESTPFRLASKYESGIVNAYFAIVVKFGDQYVRYGFDDLIDVEATPDGDVDVRLANLEYDLTRAIKKVVYGFRGAGDPFAAVDGKVKLVAIVSPSSLPEAFASIPDAVREAAKQLEQKAGGKFEFQEIDPTTDPALAQKVRDEYGARAMTLGLLDDRRFWLYGFLEVGGDREPLALADRGVSAATVREAVENALKRRVPGFLKTVGVAAPEPSIPPEVMMQLRMQGRMPPTPPPEFEQVKRTLERDYRVEDVRLGEGAGVPTDVDVLLVLKPKDLSARAVWDLDQYLMRGGRVIVCADEYDTKFDSNGLELTAMSTGLDGWLGHFGIKIDKTLVLDDRNQPLPIPETTMTPLGPLRTWKMAPYPYLVEVRDDGILDRRVAGRLEAMGLYWASPIELDKDKEKGLEVVDLLRSSARSWTDDDTSKVQYVDYRVPDEGTAPHLLAVALSGRFESYFAGKEPPPRPPAAGRPADSGDAKAAADEVPLTRSPETRLVVVSDADFLSDFVARALGRDEGGFFAENLAFTQNLIDWANLDSDLIGIRSRSAGPRRLERVERSTEIGIETANYVVPIVLLLAFGAWRAWRRRNAVPLVGPAHETAAEPRRVEG